LAQAILASYAGRDPSFAARVDYWVNFFDHKDITTISTNDIEDGLCGIRSNGKSCLNAKSCNRANRRFLEVLWLDAEIVHGRNTRKGVGLRFVDLSPRDEALLHGYLDAA
jgi:hypothetical protein